MQEGTHRVNPSQETIKVGPVEIRFLLTGGDSNGSASVFEFVVPAGQKLAAPEGDSWIALVDVQGASADEALVTA